MLESFEELESAIVSCPRRGVVGESDSEKDRSNASSRLVGLFNASFITLEGEGLIRLCGVLGTNKVAIM